MSTVRSTIANSLIVLAVCLLVSSGEGRADSATTTAEQLAKAAQSVSYVVTKSSATMVTRDGVVDLTDDFAAAQRKRCKQLGPSHPECHPTPVPGVVVGIADADDRRIVLTFTYSGGFPFDRERHLRQAAMRAVQIKPREVVLFREVFRSPDTGQTQVAHQLSYDPIRETLQADY